MIVPVIFLFIIIVGAVLWWKKALKKLFAHFFSDAKASDDIELQDQQNPLISPDRSASLHSSIPWSNVLRFTLNGKEVEVVNPDPSELLAGFIRDKMFLKGTKLGCQEGGCGACTVMVEKADGTVVSANSCLRLLCANDGMSVTTVEGVGSLQGGLSAEQQSMVDHNGTQCGFCTPGWITAMHSLRESADRTGQALQSSDIDKKFDGNICRCTGYRPIMAAFHSLCDDARKGHCGPQEAADCQVQYKDIEDIRACSHAERNLSSLTNRHRKSTNSAAKQPSLKLRSATPQPLLFVSYSTGKKFYRPLTLPQLCAIVGEYQNSPQTIKLVSGNTSIGVTKYLNNTEPFYVADDFPVMVDVNMVPELHVKTYAATGELTIGAAVSLTDVIATLKTYAKTSGRADGVPIAEGVSASSVFAVTAHHLEKVANTQVRNMASWAGNLLIFLQYKSFPSDVVLAFCTADVSITLCNATGQTFTVKMPDFMQYSFNEFKSKGYFVVSFTISERPAVSSVWGAGGSAETVMETFKIARREHNAHAFVDAGFQLLVQTSATYAPTCVYARVVYGGIAPQIFIAGHVQQALLNKPLNAATLRDCVSALQLDWQLAGGINSPLTNKDFTVSAAYACLYRIFLRAYPFGLLPASVRTALYPWVKPASRGVEVYPIDRKDAPLTPLHQAIPKLEAPAQSTGEAIYPSDEPLPANALQGALIYATQSNCTLLGVDTDSLLKIPGVVSVLLAEDLPGANLTGTGVRVFVPKGEIVPYVGSCIGVVLAETSEVANQAVSMAKVSYGSPPCAPIANLQEAIQRQSFYPPDPSYCQVVQGDADGAMKTAPYVARGRVEGGGQYHFYMENQCAVGTLEGGEKVELICGTQMPSDNQDKIAKNLNLPSSKVSISCKRTGGGFGGKITGAVTVATATALAVYKLKRPVRIFSNRTADMAMRGGREAWIGDYEVGFTADGRIVSLKYMFYVDGGAGQEDTIGGVYMGMFWGDGGYYLPNYSANALIAYTNTPPRTSMRAPGVLHTCLFIEMVVERVAKECGLSPRVVQERNMIKSGDTAICGQVITNPNLRSIWDKLLFRSDFQNRLNRVEEYNKGSLWRKRGIYIVPVKYGIGWAGYQAGVKIGVRLTDGCVIVNHSGIEIGQGINTKVAQAIAGALGIPLSLVRIEKTGTDIVVNGGVTGGSGTSEVTVQAALNACKKLNKRIGPYRTNPNRTQMTPDEWVAVIQSVPGDVSLNVEGWFNPPTNPNEQFFQYFVYAACVTEVELNVLSGECHVLTCQLLYDCGESLNPSVDIGQIEGAIILGLGFFFQEKVQYATGSGMLQTEGTWEYKPPLCQDIPSVLNITLIANAYNKDGIAGSKAVGEPPLMASNSAFFAMKMAVESARRDAGQTSYFSMAAPATVDDRQAACLVQPQRYVLPF